MLLVGVSNETPEGFPKEREAIRDGLCWRDHRQF